jgi:hypothetical protein
MERSLKLVPRFAGLPNPAQRPLTGRGLGINAFLPGSILQPHWSNKRANLRECSGAYKHVVAFAIVRRFNSATRSVGISVAAGDP